MNISNATRQVAELASLQAQWYSHAIEISTPALYSRLQKVTASSSSSSSNLMLKLKKCLSFRLHCAILHPDDLANLLLEVELPYNYPSDSVCSVRAIHADDDGLEYSGCTTLIEQYIDPSFVGVECVEMILEWLNDNKTTCLHSVAEGESKSNEGKAQCYILRYNHLLSGPEHKKEKNMMDCAKKSKLQGGLLWGTPGIVVVVPGSTEIDAKEYASDCRAIGKRADGVEQVWLQCESLVAAGLGGLAQQKRGGRLLDMTTSVLREACGNDEDLLRRVLGVC